MSWTDLESIEHIKKLRDIYGIETFVETGTHMGINAKLHSRNFKNVSTCENHQGHWEQAKKNLSDTMNVYLSRCDSDDFLSNRINYQSAGAKMPFFYLDAHFYDPKRENKFVVLDELKALKDFGDCVIAIHDFANGLGHITYEGQPLDLELVREDLFNVNSDFHLYTNELSSCRIKKISKAESIHELDTLRYVWSKPEKTYRGILYATPTEVQVDGLRPIR